MMISSGYPVRPFKRLVEYEPRKGGGKCFEGQVQLVIVLIIH